MEKTAQHEEHEIKKIIQKNSLEFHPNDKISTSPWFNINKTKASEVLLQALKSVSYNHKQFALKAAKIVMVYKEEKENDELKYATSLRESIDISNLIPNIDLRTLKNSYITVKTVKNNSRFQVYLVYQKVFMAIDEVEEAKFDVKLTDSIIIKFKTFDGNENPEITEKNIVLSDILKNTHYFSAVSKGFIEDLLIFFIEEFEIILNVKVWISKADSLTLLKNKKNEIEVELEEISGKYCFYDEMLKALKIEQLDEGFLSSVSREKSKNKCCGECLVF